MLSVTYQWRRLVESPFLDVFIAVVIGAFAGFLLGALLVSGALLLFA